MNGKESEFKLNNTEHLDSQEGREFCDDAVYWMVAEVGALGIGIGEDSYMYACGNKKYEEVTNFRKIRKYY